MAGSAFLSALENHGVWKEAQQSASGEKSNLVRNVLALDSFQQLFFHNPEDGGSSISVINLKRIRSEGADESYQVPISSTLLSNLLESYDPFCADDPLQAAHRVSHSRAALQREVQLPVRGGPVQVCRYRDLRPHQTRVLQGGEPVR